MPSVSSVKNMVSLFERPRVCEEAVRASLRRLYGIDSPDIIDVEELNGYDDKNYRIQVKSYREGFVFKVMNALDSERTDLIEGQHAMMEFLSSKGFSVPLPVIDKFGRYYATETFGNGQSKHVVRLLKYLEGIPVAEATSDANLYENVGEFTASLSLALQDFHHRALANRCFSWSLAMSPQILRHVDVVESPERRALVKFHVKSFEDDVLTKMDALQKGIIHGDVNEHNLLVARPSSTKIVALLDFGDAHEAPTMFEAALALTYSMIHANGVSPARPFLKGYEKLRKLTDLERSLLKTCVCARLCQSLVLGLVSAQKDPCNEYVLSTQKSGWKLLEEISSNSFFEEEIQRKD